MCIQGQVVIYAAPFVCIVHIVFIQIARSVSWQIAVGKAIDKSRSIVRVYPSFIIQIALAVPWYMEGLSVHVVSDSVGFSGHKVVEP